MITEAQQIVVIARSYAAATGLDLKTVSARCFGDSKKLRAIDEGGADLTLTRARDTVQWFSDNWPKAAIWPAAIDRPAVNAGVAA